MPDEQQSSALRVDDIGRCDLCGSEDGERRLVFGAWLCDSCADSEPGQR